MAVFTPTLIVHNVLDLTPSLLRRMGIEALVLDVDNTLTTHGSQTPLDGVLDWLDLMKREGFLLTISSNNTQKRVEPFARSLGLDYVCMSCKPFPVGLSKAIKKFGLQKEKVAIVGDQIYTDIIGGNLKGITTILVAPIRLEEGFFFRLKRRLEKPWVRRYYNKKRKED